MQRATERVLATPFTEEPHEYALAIIKNLMPFTVESRAEFEVNLALYAEHLAVPALAPIRQHAHDQIETVCTRIIQMLTGTEDVETSEVSRLHALIDGLAFHLLHQPPEATTSWATAILEEEAKRISTPQGD